MEKTNNLPTGAPTEEQVKKAQDVIVNMWQQTSFLKETLESGRCSGEIIDTHLSLLRYQFDDLAAALGQDSHLDKRLEEVTEMLRKANARIHDLESQTGESVSTDAAVARIKKITDWFQTWYSLSGFHYASLTHTENGFYADFSDETETPPETEEEKVQITFGDKALALQIADLIPYLFSSDYEMYHDTYHYNILDCDKNRKLLTDLFESTFPGCTVYEFHGRRETGHHGENSRTVLRIKVYLTYKSITDWYLDIMEKRKITKGIRHSGRLYVKQAELAYKQKSKLFNSHASEAQKNNVNKELEQISPILSLWEEFGTIPINEDTECIETSWNEFPAGTARDDIWHWFEEQFDLSVAEDLMGQHPIT